MQDESKRIDELVSSVPEIGETRPFTGSQFHIPLKVLGFDEAGGVSGVNMTIGLPIIRTSVDHGTAFDIAGEGVASETSMVDAIRVAADVARRRGGTES